jgi:hypothetical protein
MTTNDRKQKIKSYGAAYQQLTAALKRFPKEMWQYRPAPGDWTIHEILVHIADSEANSYVRCRRFIAEPGSAVLGYDESKWARDLHYHDQSPDDAVELFRWLRKQSYDLVKNLPEETWSNTVEHSENGLMTLDDWLGIYEQHISDHIAQMQAVHDAWVKQRAFV